MTTPRGLRVVIVSQYYKPEDARIPTTLARGLAERGHQVRVVTGYPNYPHGRLYPGYRQSVVRHEQDGQVAVRRVPLIISHSHNPFGRFANYATFALTSLTASRFVRNADVAYVYATQMTASVAPHVWRLTRGTPFVLHIQDLWPESVTGSSLVRVGVVKRAINALLTPWLNQAYRASGAVIAIAPTMQRMLAERGVDVRKLHTVLNWADEDHTEPVAHPETERTGLTVVYAGSLGHLQDLETVIEAAKLVTDLEGFRVLIVGSGIAEDRLKVVAEGVANVELLGRVPIAEMNEIYSMSDFQLVTLRNLAIFSGTIPSKLQGSLAAGVPVISTVNGDARSIIESAGVGLTAEPEDRHSLAEVFRTAYRMEPSERRRMGARAIEYYEATMSMNAGVDRIEQILRDVARDSETRNEAT